MAEMGFQIGDLIENRYRVLSVIGSDGMGTLFSGRIVETTTFGPYPAIIPEVEGTAHITGRHEFLIDPDDLLRDGFILR